MTISAMEDMRRRIEKLEQKHKLFIKEIGNYLDTDRFEYLIGMLTSGEKVGNPIIHAYNCHCNLCKKEDKKKDEHPN